MSHDKIICENTFRVKLATVESIDNINEIRVKSNLPVIEKELLGTQLGILEGYMSTFNNTDLVGDVIRKGAFTKTLSERQVKVLYQHNPGQPIGIMLNAYEDNKGLYGIIQLNLETQLGREVYSQYKMGAMDSFSIGFQLQKYTIVDGGYDITEVKLHEVSAVTFPANEQAVVQAVKDHYEDMMLSTEETINNKVKEAESVDELLDILTLLTKPDNDEALAKELDELFGAEPEEDFSSLFDHSVEEEAVADIYVETEEPVENDHSDDLNIFKE